ncbi:MAG: hypothetical protein FD152_2219 [Xanthobacteraceae bacterium]|nr:MAG: hypothetical protein FD152_2219 [Xanthobacteraceae bacterium]
MELVDQDPRGLRAGDYLGVEALHLQCGAGALVGDALQMRLDVKHLVRQVAVEGDGTGRLVEGEIGNLLGRSDQQERGVRPLIDQERDHHQQRTVGGLGVLLRHQEEDLADEPLARRGIERTEQRPHDGAEPLAGRPLHSRASLHIGKPQHVERVDGLLGGFGEQRKIGNEGPAGAQPFLPIRTGEGPGGHQLGWPPALWSTPSQAEACAATGSSLADAFSPVPRGS